MRNNYPNTNMSLGVTEQWIWGIYLPLTYSPISWVGTMLLDYHFEHHSVESFAPIADAEPIRHGHWIRSSDGYWDECSKCHASIDISMGSGLYNADGDQVEHDWCPHCGAKMDERREDGKRDNS